MGGGDSDPATPVPTDGPTSSGTFDATSVDDDSDGDDPDPAMMQECNFCGGSLKVTNKKAVISIPKDANFDFGSEDATTDTATCKFVQKQCDTGFCSTEICDALTTEDNRDTCGCEELEI